MNKKQENLSLFAIGAFTLALLIIADHYGLPHKWRTAIFGTTVPFPIVAACYSRRWRRWSFWASFMICVAGHIAAMCAFFEYVAVRLAPGWLLWTPVAFVETFILLVLVGRIENKLTGRHDAIRIS